MNKRDYDHFLWMGSYCLTRRSTDPLGEDSLLFTTRFLPFSGTHLIDLGKMILESILEPLSGF